MKKSLIALAVMATAGAASAQSSVTLFGVVDAALQLGRGDIADVTRIGSGGLATSRLGFRGVEDLGGGNYASFWLEAGFNADNGTGQPTNTNNQASGATTGSGLTFNRRATVSLHGGWGEVRLGRDFTPQYSNLSAFDPFGDSGVGATLTTTAIITGVTSTRASNTIAYFLPPNLGGFYGTLQYHAGENPDNVGPTEDDGRGYGLRIGYATGPLNVGLALSRVDNAAGDIKQNNIGASYDFGMAKLMGQITRDSNGATDGDGWLIGATADLGAGELRAAYSQYKRDNAVGADLRTRKVALGYVYNLSKRTAVYTTVARVTNRGAFVPITLNGAVAPFGGSSSGFDLGIRHAF